MASEPKGPMTDEEIYMLASEHEHEHGTDMFGFARALLAEAGERVADNLDRLYDNIDGVKSEVKRILVVKHE